MITEYLDAAENFQPARWLPCPAAEQRGEWDALPCKARWAQYGKGAGKKVPALPLSLWLSFSKTGNRTRYEAAYFARRKTLCRLVMAECAEYTSEHLPTIADYVWAICEESAWQLPAHNSYIRDTPQLPLPDVTRPIVDLFAAETGTLISMVHYLLGRELDKCAPGIKKRMSDEVKRRILKPYRTVHFWWMGSGDEPMCNWTPWCTQNVLIAAALLDYKNAEHIKADVKQAAYSLDCFLKDYGEDGCCSEGAQYYRHAGLCLFNALELLCALAPNVFDEAWQQPKIKNIAEYIANMHVCGPYYFNFADCSPLAGKRGVREYLFGKRVGSAPLMTLAAADFADDDDADVLCRSDDSEGINLFYHVQIAFNEAELLSHSATGEKSPSNIFYKSVGLLCCRSGAYAAGIKAGCNADSHNHNDTGSVTLYKNGKPLLIDVGVGSYTKKTFSPRRYEIWTMQSSSHNLPEFAPDGKKHMQQPGEKYRAAYVRVQPALDGISMDIAPAYSANGEVAGLTSYRRSVTLTENGLLISDETDYPDTCALSLMSEQAPRVDGDTVHFGTLGYAKADCSEKITTETIQITDARLRTAWPKQIYRTRVYFKHALIIHII